MKITIGLKMGGCFFLTLAELILSSSYALNGIINIRSALEHIAGDAWQSAVSSAALSLNVNQGAGLLRNSLLIKAEDAVSVMQTGQNLAVHNVSVSEQVQQLIETVSGEINRNNGLNLLIATATEEQANVTSLPRDNLERISSVSSETAEGARSNSNISMHLEQQAEHLRTVLSQFKV